MVQQQILTDMDIDLDEIRQQVDIETLDELQALLEYHVSHFAVTQSENLKDEEENCISRFVLLNRGSEEYMVVFKPNGFIRLYNEKMPASLLVDIHNSFAAFRPNNYSIYE